MQPNQGYKPCLDAQKTAKEKVTDEKGERRNGKWHREKVEEDIYK